MGAQGISKFLTAHNCNPICAALGLPPLGVQILPDAFRTMIRPPSGAEGGGDPAAALDKLFVNVVEARGLVAKDKDMFFCLRSLLLTSDAAVKATSSDPFCLLKVSAPERSDIVPQVFKTSTVRMSLTPKWNANCVL
jgi:hypothetical protein